MAGWFCCTKGEGCHRRFDCIKLSQPSNSLVDSQILTLKPFKTLQSEDEAMARALAASMNDTQPDPQQQDTGRQQQEDADAALARALQMSEQEARNQRGGRSQVNRVRRITDFFAVC